MKLGVSSALNQFLVGKLDGAAERVAETKTMMNLRFAHSGLAPGGQYVRALFCLMLFAHIDTNIRFATFAFAVGNMIAVRNRSFSCRTAGDGT